METVDAHHINKMNERQIDSFEAALQFITQDLQDTPKSLFRHGAGIERTKTWLEALDNPQETFKSVHVAGTSGKGSTSYFISSLLAAHDLHIGTHTSPHVFDIRERMMVNLTHPSEAEFVEKVRDIVPYIRHMAFREDGRPTYFEVTNALAMQFFRDHEVDYGVIETGIGGRYDSTNTIHRSDKLAVITRLGLDHTELLGETLEDIAWQKAGIIPWGGDVVALRPEIQGVEAVIAEVARERGSHVHWVDPGNIKVESLHTRGVGFEYAGFKGLQTSTPGSYQAENAALALEAVRLLAKRDGWSLNEEAVSRGIDSTELPGRANLWHIEGQDVLVDAAHNPQKIEAFLSSVASHEKWRSPQVVFAAKQGKEWQPSLDKIADIAEHVHITQFFVGAGKLLQKYSVDDSEYSDYIKQRGLKNVTVGYERASHALVSALQRDGPVIVLGSMYMLGELYEDVRHHL